MALITESQWWRDTLAGKRTPIQPDVPREGYYCTRGYRGGPMLPARLWSLDGAFHCLVAGETRNPLKEWPYLAAKPITAARYSETVAVLKVVGGPKEARKAKLYQLPPRF